MSNKRFNELELKDTNSKMKLIERETSNDTTKPLGTETTDYDDGRVKVVQIKTVYKSKRWILALICLCIILTVTLIGCFINYRKCCYVSNGGSAHAIMANRLPLNCSYKRDSDSDYDMQSQEIGDELFQETLNKSWNNSRLPENLKPYFYKIDLRIDVEKRVFTGSCSIKFTCLEKISFLVLHSEENVKFNTINYLPKIHEGASDLRLGRRLALKNMTYNSFFNYIIIELGDGEYFRRKRNYTVVFENFSSEIKNDLKGIYYGTYNSKNVTRWAFRGTLREAITFLLCFCLRKNIFLFHNKKGLSLFLSCSRLTLEKYCLCSTSQI